MGFHSSDSSRGVGGVNFTLGGVKFTQGWVGMPPKGGLSQHLRGSRALLKTTKPKKFEKQNTKTHPKMLLIGCLGGHAPSGENQWVEGQRGQTAGQRGEAGQVGP